MKSGTSCGSLSRNQATKSNTFPHLRGMGSLPDETYLPVTPQPLINRERGSGIQKGDLFNIVWVCLSLRGPFRLLPVFSANQKDTGTVSGFLFPEPLELLGSNSGRTVQEKARAGREEACSKRLWMDEILQICVLLWEGNPIFSFSPQGLKGLAYHMF